MEPREKGVWEAVGGAVRNRVGREGITKKGHLIGMCRSPGSRPHADWDRTVQVKGQL